MKSCTFWLSFSYWQIDVGCKGSQLFMCDIQIALMAHFDRSRACYCSLRHRGSDVTCSAAPCPDGHPELLVQTF